MPKPWGEPNKTATGVLNAQGRVDTRDLGRFSEVEPVSGFSAEPGFTLTDNGDGTLTVTDSQARFGTKPGGGKPLFVFYFGSGSDQPTSLGRIQIPVNWSDACFLDAGISRGEASHSMIVDTNVESGDGSNSITTDDSVLQFDADGSDKFYRCLINYNDFVISDLSGTSYNFKTQRWQGNDMPDDPHTVNTLQGGSYLFAFAGDEGGASTMYSANELETKKWRVEEEYNRVSSAAGVNDAGMWGLVDGQLKFARVSVDSHKGLDPAQTPWQHFKLGNFRFWAPKGQSQWRWHLQYIDNSWCRVQIKDQNSWDESDEHLVEPQIPQHWEPGSVRFLLKAPATGLVGRHLWVVDNDNSKHFIGTWSDSQ